MPEGRRMKRSEGAWLSEWLDQVAQPLVFQRLFRGHPQLWVPLQTPLHKVQEHGKAVRHIRRSRSSVVEHLGQIPRPGWPPSTALPRYAPAEARPPIGADQNGAVPGVPGRRAEEVAYPLRT